MIASWIRQFISNFNQYVAPPFCASCNRLLQDEILFCAPCATLVKPIASKLVTLSKTQEFTVFASGIYQPPLLSLLHAKYYGQRAVAYDLGLFLWEHSALPTIEFDYIVPVPLHWTRLAWRGFNQAEEIGRALSSKSKRPLAHLLNRVRRTQSQAALPKDERMRNVSSAFQLSCSKELRDKYRGAHILLVDDLYTTGATVREAASILFELQPKSVSVAVICRV